MKREPVIHLKNIIKSYHLGDSDYQALKGITIEIFEGEFVAIMGPSGSGKSTAMHIMGALDSPTSGQYYLDGTEISKYTANQLAKIRNKRIGFVFQSFNLLARTTVLKNVERPMMYGNVPIADREGRALDMLEMVHLKDKAHNLSNQLSGGQIQRVAIARALVMNPTMILADEPTGNLDSKTSHEVMSFLQKMNDQGKTVVVITHEPDIAAYAKRIIMLKDGLVLTDKSNKQVRSTIES
ncbi:MAG TPA: ABC transporter ATP-binding protein [Patescibacteria group bacterium]|nr:ABC transporter ATP-binding protein [Patescibacteria group bacterium]